MEALKRLKTINQIITKGNMRRTKKGNRRRTKFNVSKKLLVSAI